MSEDDRIGNFLSDSDRVKASKNKQTNQKQNTTSTWNFQKLRQTWAHEVRPPVASGGIATPNGLFLASSVSMVRKVACLERSQNAHRREAHLIFTSSLTF